MLTESLLRTGIQPSMGSCTLSLRWGPLRAAGGSGRPHRILTGSPISLRGGSQVSGMDAKEAGIWPPHFHVCVCVGGCSLKARALFSWPQLLFAGRLRKNKIKHLKQQSPLSRPLRVSECELCLQNRAPGDSPRCLRALPSPACPRPPLPPAPRKTF